jgi:hypothetical protein
MLDNWQLRKSLKTRVQKIYSEATKDIHGIRLNAHHINEVISSPDCFQLFRTVLFRCVPGCSAGVPARLLRRCCGGVPGYSVLFRRCSGLFRRYSGLFRRCSGLFRCFGLVFRVLVHAVLINSFLYNYHYKFCFGIRGVKFSLTFIAFWIFTAIKKDPRKPVAKHFNTRKALDW